MTTTATTLMSDRSPASHAGRRTFLRDLDHRGQAVSYFTPNWFAAVMGTGIVAVAAHSLPWSPYGLPALATAFWLGACALLVGAAVATAAHWRRYPRVARGHASDPVMAHFYGAPPMALLTVGASTLLVGSHLIGATAALRIDWVLWALGTATGVSAAVIVPYRMLVRGTVPSRAAFGGHLMPVVPPMVSASTGALLVPHVFAGAARTTLFVACYALFGLSLAASVPVIALIARRLASGDVGEARFVPTLWIVLGPLGQSITAVNLLGGVAPITVSARTARDLHGFGIVYGIAVWVFAMAWLVTAAAVTIRTARAHLPFSLTWWSFTFPVGTVVTGTSGLAAHTGDELLRVAAVGLFVLLLAAWSTVATRTAHAVFRGQILRSPPAGLLLPAS